jgi:hypothetical protein
LGENVLFGPSLVFRLIASAGQFIVAYGNAKPPVAAETLQFFCVFTGKANKWNYNTRPGKVKKKNRPRLLPPQRLRG